ncbi:MAG: FAD-binding oxidoreductase, partial [Beijerinckiaceae bacterium]
MIPVSSWGRLSAEPHWLVSFSDRARISQTLSENCPGLPRGMGRSYGDVCLNPGGALWMTPQLDRLIAFDQSSGSVTCEAGVLLKDLQRVALARGFMLPVTPGTQIVTVGGAIANDVHGKNHHRRGSFGDHVLGFTLHRTSGEVMHVMRDSHPGLFAATLGGLGLTGFISQAVLQLVRTPGPWLETETLA